MHFIAFLINFASWIVLGYFVGKNANQIYKKKLNLRKNLIVGTIGGIAGGLFGFLLNGLPNSTFFLNNFLYALVFSASAVSVTKPNFVKSLKNNFSFQIKLPLFISKRTS